MDNISRVLSRIDTIRTQLGMPAQPGGFQTALDAQMSSFDPVAEARLPAAATIRTTLGGTPVTPVTSWPSGRVVSAADLDAYVRTLGLEERNGRLDGSELQSITGGWNGGDYALIPPAADAYEQMRAAAAQDGVNLQVIDAYRSWEVQAAAYEDYLAGRKKAHVLPPGTSEHGQGMAVDFTNGSILGQDDPEWAWLQNNARRFGWHPISNEAWHWEFRGA